MSIVNFHLPVHPCYFTGDVTQENLERAAHEYVEAIREGKGSLFGRPTGFIFVREPGQFVGVRIDQNALTDAQKVGFEKLSPLEQALELARMKHLQERDFQNIKSSIFAMAG